MFLIQTAKSAGSTTGAARYRLTNHESFPLAFSKYRQKSVSTTTSRYLSAFYVYNHRRKATIDFCETKWPRCQRAAWNGNVETSRRIAGTSPNESSSASSTR